MLRKAWTEYESNDEVSEIIQTKGYMCLTSERNRISMRKESLGDLTCTGYFEYLLDAEDIQTYITYLTSMRKGMAEQVR